jgi:hypothetical protein
VKRPIKIGENFFGRSVAGRQKRIEQESKSQTCPRDRTTKPKSRRLAARLRHSPTLITEFVPYGMHLPCDINRIDPIFVCRAVRHLPNMSDCVNTPLAPLNILKLNDVAGCNRRFRTLECILNDGRKNLAFESVDEKVER